MVENADEISLSECYRKYLCREETKTAYFDQVAVFVRDCLRNLDALEDERIRRRYYRNLQRNDV